MKKKSNKFALTFGVILASLFVILVGLKIYLELRSHNAMSKDLTYVLKPSKTDLKVGEKVSVPVYLSGKDAAKVSAYDIKLYYDPTKLKLTKVIPGGFFEKYITVKWDQKQSWYALALTPSETNTESRPDLPILTLELTAVAKSEGTQVTTGISTVYVTKTGGFQPKSGSVNINIK